MCRHGAAFIHITSPLCSPLQQWHMLRERWLECDYRFYISFATDIYSDLSCRKIARPNGIIYPLIGTVYRQASLMNDKEFGLWGGGW